jgi:hypothetical protein
LPAYVQVLGERWLVNSALLKVKRLVHAEGASGFPFEAKIPIDVDGKRTAQSIVAKRRFVAGCWSV